MLLYKAKKRTMHDLESLYRFTINLGNSCKDSVNLLGLKDNNTICRLNFFFVNFLLFYCVDAYLLC